VAAVMGAPRDVYVNLPTYSESASAHHDDEMALPVSIFDDPLLEEMPFFVETSKRKLEIGSMSPVAANRKRLSIDVPEPFDDVCESSPLGIPRRRRRLSANGRRTTLHELLSPRRTLNMGVSEESKRVHDLKPTDLDSARETPQVVAQKAGFTLAVPELDGARRRRKSIAHRRLQSGASIARNRRPARHALETTQSRPVVRKVI
jgi:hypothetical protein